MKERGSSWDNKRTEGGHQHISTFTYGNAIDTRCLARESFQDCCNKTRRCNARQTSPSLVPRIRHLSSRSSRPHLIQTASKQTHGGWDVLKWDWRRVAECGRITGVFRQTADRERNWVGERPPRGRSSTSRQMHCQLFAYSKWMTRSQPCCARPSKINCGKKRKKRGVSALFDRPLLPVFFFLPSSCQWLSKCHSWITAWEHPNHLSPD